MTDEIKCEIWAMLPEATKAVCRRIYIKEENAGVESYGRGYRDALADVFGSHNLTAKAEGKGKSDGESNDESNLQQSVVSSVDYSQYRLDLAKEIAVAMINSKFDDDVAVCSVIYANEIVKRLKETEE